jgi:hypothetical protein
MLRLPNLLFLNVLSNFTQGQAQVKEKDRDGYGGLSFEQIIYYPDIIIQLDPILKGLK